MNIHDSENIVQQGVIIETYEFQIGTLTPIYIYYTSSNEGHVIDGHNFESAAIERSGISLTDQFDPVECTVTLPYQLHDTELNICDHIKTLVRLNKVRLTIRRYFDYDFDYCETIFSGILKSYSMGDGFADLNFTTIADEITRIIPLVKAQSLCNNVFCDDVCGLNIGDYMESFHITVSGGGTVLSSSFFADHANGYYAGGRVNKFDETDIYRLVTKHEGESIVINRKFYDLESDDMITIVPVCNRSPATCLNTFNNLAQFVGMPYMPLVDLTRTAVTNG